MKLPFRQTCVSNSLKMSSFLANKGCRELNFGRKKIRHQVVTLAVQAQVLIVILSCLLYVFLPHDLVPDLTSPIGLLDDFILVVFVLVFLSNVYRSLMSHHQPRRVLTRTAQQAPESHFSPLHHRQRARNHFNIFYWFTVVPIGGLDRYVIKWVREAS